MHNAKALLCPRSHHHVTIGTGSNSGFPAITAFLSQKVLMLTLRHVAPTSILKQNKLGQTEQTQYCSKHIDIWAVYGLKSRFCTCITTPENHKFLSASLHHFEPFAQHTLQPAKTQASTRQYTGHHHPTSLNRAV